MSCSIVEFTDKHLTQEYVDWLNNPELMKYSEQRHLSHSLSSCLDYINSFKGTDNILFAVVDNKTGKHVGNINAHVDARNRVADIGILIAYGGKGYGLSAWNQMMEVLFSSPLRIRKVTAGTMQENEGMLKIFKKSGMLFEYKKLRHFYFENRFVDMIAYYKEAEE